MTLQTIPIASKTIYPSFNDVFENCECPFDAWETPAVKFELYSKYVDWVLSLADWTSFITLTFREDVSMETAVKRFRYLVRILNIETFGNNYTHIVHHSYFSYVLAAEYQQRNVLHFHVLIDRPINFKTIHSFWNMASGFAQTKIIADRIGTVRYVVKYATKKSDLSIYQAKAFYKPVELPSWWHPVKQ